jgi:hypothetical protein
VKINLTTGEAQALCDLMDEKTRLGGLQAAALYGPIARQIIDAAQAEKQAQEADNGNADTDD